jgi:hypothetical protein
MTEPYWEPFGGPQGPPGAVGPAGPALPSVMCYAYGIATPAGGALALLNINGSRWADWSPSFTVGQPRIFVPPTGGRCRVTMTAWWGGQSGGVGVSVIQLDCLNAAGAVAEAVLHSISGNNGGSTLVHSYPFEAGGSVRMQASSQAGGAGGNIYAFLTIDKLT